ncbi:hypothetical protein J4467_00300 [Candidatus Woesearchaeota archaeon]|nr:hypothetical protein [Candidatus Woesearchaeota archaeon]
MTLDKILIMNPKIDTDRHQHLMFKGPDGKNYVTSEGLAQATEAYERATLFKIAHDAVRDRVEIPYDSGDVQICVGHKIEHDYDADGVATRREVPVYRTETF